MSLVHACMHYCLNLSTYFSPTHRQVGSDKKLHFNLVNRLNETGSLMSAMLGSGLLSCVMMHLWEWLQCMVRANPHFLYANPHAPWEIFCVLLMSLSIEKLLSTLLSRSIITCWDNFLFNCLLGCGHEGSTRQGPVVWQPGGMLRAAGRLWGECQMPRTVSGHSPEHR